MITLLRTGVEESGNKSKLAQNHQAKVKRGSRDPVSVTDKVLHEVLHIEQKRGKHFYN